MGVDLEGGGGGGEEGRRALLVLGYCCGGDLFEVASGRREVLTPGVVRRVFAELVGAVGYLHGKGIVHRDIKLESDALLQMPDPTTHPTALITLTDLGLSRRIPDPPASPLLTTRCGSEDYAAPEILLGQPYDGRATDAWALGVLLYALMEGRLPFDVPPAGAGGRAGRGAAAKGGRSRTTHRIARCEWMWWRFGDEDGAWDGARDPRREWQGAREAVEGLLRKVSRGRKSLAEVAGGEWVAGGVRVQGGLRAPGEEGGLDERDARDGDGDVYMVGGR
ncbi:kinase-like domain-containing protein [Lineolata rhizophorae]|uniref:Kinase-like domain-containing protein n=1 Tax=Lineolata rhizophorae TaxID=578093 RepID=A0A6A6NYG7_9PEZI|nr:kinase-like domain-containing protein [Lineolata rhizophorae]